MAKEIRTANKIAYGKKYYQENKEIILARSRNHYHKNKEAISIRHKKAHLNRDIRELLIERAKRRAKTMNLDFNLTKEDIIVTDNCPILGIPMKRNVGGKTSADNSYSLDRINPSLGYIKGNVHVISWKANYIKKNATPDELKMLADWVNRNLK